MNIILKRCSLSVCAVGMVVLSTGCVVAGGGYGYDGNVGVGVGVDYYEPVGGYYGNWEPGYQVGPYRDGGRRFDGDRGSHAYRSAPGSRSMPSIPSRSRGSGRR